MLSVRRRVCTTTSLLLPFDPQVRSWRSLLRYCRATVRACVRVGTTLLSRVAARALRPATRSCCTTARIMNAAPHHRLLHPLGCLGYWRDVRTRALTDVRTRALTGCILKSVHVDVVLEYLAALSLSQATPPQYSWHANYTVRPNTPGPGVVLRGARQPRAATSTAGVRRAMLRLCTRPEAHGTGAAVVFVHELAAAARMSESKCVHQHSLSSRRTASKEPLWLQASPHRCFFFSFFSLFPTSFHDPLLYLRTILLYTSTILVLEYTCTYSSTMVRTRVLGV